MGTGLLIAGIVAALALTKKKGVSGISGTSFLLTGTVERIELDHWTNYGIPVYRVYINNGFRTFECYTSPRGQLPHIINNLLGRSIPFEGTEYKYGKMVLTKAFGYHVGD